MSHQEQWQRWYCKIPLSEEAQEFLLRLDLMEEGMNDAFDAIVENNKLQSEE